MRLHPFSSRLLTLLPLPVQLLLSSPHRLLASQSSVPLDQSTRDHRVTAPLLILPRRCCHCRRRCCPLPPQRAEQEDQQRERVLPGGLLREPAGAGGMPGAVEGPVAGAANAARPAQAVPSALQVSDRLFFGGAAFRIHVAYCLQLRCLLQPGWAKDHTCGHAVDSRPATARLAQPWIS